ncbi:MAG: DsbA family oxidoreductase [Hyphomonadaceae bacterium]|jgi:predicted DsbA family dithiol-disulfide isomerase|nr:DsbA family oxidoreductase [Hyphomonadaceae bacterium]
MTAGRADGTGSATNLPVVRVDLVSDIVCPWCYIGFRSFLMGWRERPDVPVALTFRAFQLDPSVPPEGVDRQAGLLAKFGGDFTRFAAASAAVAAAGASVGIQFAMDKAKTLPNTLDCHRLLRWANDAGLGMACAEALFEACHVTGADLTRAETLVEIAETIGMERVLVADLLASDLDRAAIVEEVGTARQMGITSVPCFIFNSRFAVVGGEPATTFIQAIDRAVDEARITSPD